MPPLLPLLAGWPSHRATAAQGGAAGHQHRGGAAGAERAWQSGRCDRGAGQPASASASEPASQRARQAGRRSAHVAAAGATARSLFCRPRSRGCRIDVDNVRVRVRRLWSCWRRSGSWRPGRWRRGRGAREGRVDGVSEGIIATAATGGSVRRQRRRRRGRTRHGMPWRRGQGRGEGWITSVTRRWHPCEFVVLAAHPAQQACTHTFGRKVVDAHHHPYACARERGSASSAR
jgi:hypothetical protein